ncbi:hypothetical protein NDU88_003826 [Pleurodeles waltl]|uniref:Uncharacterized protein n=1 Tax=Pleurodeles waltl TaxID=8319 RepID=A0AAV7UDT6_PLEWA|nr:hypothetical protein NDU88_003826 [Pleurodeles waltl]
MLNLAGVLTGFDLEVDDGVVGLYELCGGVVNDAVTCGELGGFNVCLAVCVEQISKKWKMKECHCNRLRTRDADRTYPGATFEYGTADPEVVGRATANRRGTNAEAGGFFKPGPNKQGGEQFSPGEEDAYGPECQTDGSEEKTPGGRQCCEERPTNPGEEPERGVGGEMV